MKFTITIFFLICFLFTFDSFSQEYNYSINGTYHFKNLIIENPFSYQLNEYSVNKVVLNGKTVMVAPKSSAFEVNLSSLTENDSFHVSLYYKSWGRPKVVNLHQITHPDLQASNHITKFEGFCFGKNLYFENPIDHEEETYCIKQVKINGKLFVNEIKSTAYELNFEKAGILKGQQVVIEVHHDRKYKPKLLNPQALRIENHFVFLEVTLKNKLLEWKTTNEKVNGKFFVELFFNENWVVVSEINVNKINGKFGTYIEPISGDNKFRIKYVEELPYHEESFSNTVEYFNDTEPKEFFPQNVDKKLHLTGATLFEITDNHGKHLLYGKTTEIDFSSYPSGVYYIYFDNTIGKFYKK